jgi:GAF domain-containing protein
MTASDSAPKTNLLQRVARPSSYATEDKARTALYLNVLLPAAMMLLGARVLFAFAQQNFKLEEADFLLLGLIAFFGALWVVTRRGYVLAAASALLLVVFFVMVYLAAQSNGLFDGAFAGLAVVILMAGLLLGWKATAVMAGLSIATAWWLAGQSAGAPIVLKPNDPLDYARDITIVFTLVAVLTYLLLSSLRRTLERSRTAEQSLRQQNLELTQLQSALEERVVERTEQLRAAADVGRVAGSILDAQQLLSEVVNVIATRFGFYYAAVFTLDHSGSYLILREATGEAGRVLQERGHRLRVGLDSMVGYAVMKREPRVALKAGDDAVRFANPLLPDTQSEIALPLIAGDQVLGALDVQAIQQNAFDEASIDALQSVAAQIAISLQNVQSYQRLQDALNYTTGQYELSRTIFTARSAQDVYQSLGQVFAMMRGIDRISLLRITDRDSANQPAEYEMMTEWDVLGGAQFDTGLRYKVADAPFAQLVTPDEVTIIHDSLDNRLPLSIREQLTQVGAQAVLLVPLTIRGQYEGFLAAAAGQAHDFQDSEVRLLRSVAEQLGVALNNLQLTAEMQTTLERVALLNRQLSSEAWGSYLQGRDQWLVESGHAQPDTLSARLQVPIVIRGEPIGAFDVADARADRQWQEDDLTLLQTIAGEVALAIENARLIEQTQRTAQREKDIATAADKIHRSVNLDALLQTAVEEVMRIAGTTDVAIQLGGPAAAAGDGQRVALP